MTPSSTDDPGRGPVRVDVPRRALSHFAPLIGRARYDRLRKGCVRARTELADRTVWCISSTAAGGGVAELLRVLVGYILDAGIDIRWLVVQGDPDFFTITKRVHNRIHGTPGDAGSLGPAESAHLSDVADANLAGLLSSVRPGDVVVLHDPQTAAMAPALGRAGALVVWRSHVGREGVNTWTEEAWEFLRPHLAGCDAIVFSVRSYAPPWADDDRLWVIPPSIDPFSPKNQDLAPETVLSILGTIGLVEVGPGQHTGQFTRADGSIGTVERRGSIVALDEAPLDPASPLVLQVSRWDRLKDMVGVMNGFAAHVAGRVDADLALVGPAVDGVTDDPEEGQVYRECLAGWAALPPAVRGRVRLVALPMDDLDENAAMVNALQRHATVAVQKSLREGFGLTVAESMWKGTAVVGSRSGASPNRSCPGPGCSSTTRPISTPSGGSSPACCSTPSRSSGWVPPPGPTSSPTSSATVTSSTMPSSSPG